MDSSTLNGQIWELTTRWEKGHPGSRAHGERVAVYSVATGHKLGLDASDLLNVRVLAELSEIPNAISEIAPNAIQNSTYREVVALCKNFDARRSGYGELSAMSDAEAVTWLDRDARLTYSAALVDALLAVQAIIQPIGT